MADELSVMVTAYPDRPGFSLHLEPEGMTYEMAPGDHLRLTFTGDLSFGLDLSHLPDGLVVCRPLDARARVFSMDGHELPW
jgi:hypothetical protein